MSAHSALHERWTEYAANNRSLRVITLGLALANVILVGMLAFRSEIVTINPPDPQGVIQYSKSKASDDALTSWGLYLATLIGNVSPSNAEFVSNSVAKILDPSIYQEVMLSISKQTKLIQEDQLSLHFEPADVKFNARDNVVYVTGWLTTKDSHGTASREQRTYELWWKVTNYQPRLTGMKAYPGTAKMNAKG